MARSTAYGTRGSKLQARQGFTLVELLVVTAIIGIIAAIMLPAIARIRDRARQTTAAERSTEAERALGNLADGLGPGTRSSVTFDAFFSGQPIVDSLDMDILLRSSYQREGMGVSAFYEAECIATLTVRPVPDSGQLAVIVPFPKGQSAIRDISFRLSDPGKETSWEPDDVILHPSGIYWRAENVPDTPLNAEVKFTALGREQFQYRLPPAQKLNRVDIALLSPVW